MTSGSLSDPSSGKLDNLKNNYANDSGTNSDSNIRVEMNSNSSQHKSYNSDHVKSGTALVAGGLAGMLAKTVVAPLERIKIMFQVTHEPFLLSKFPEVMTAIVNKDGVLALWRGNAANMLRVAPYAGIQFMVYDLAKRYFAR